MIVCANDVVAYGALNAARELGLEVPRDVSITGFDDLPEASWPLLQLTTVAFDLEAMARRAAGLLVDRLRLRPRRAVPPRVVREPPRRARHPRPAR